MQVYSADNSIIVPTLASSSVILCIFVALLTNLSQKFYFFFRTAKRNYVSDNEYENYWLSTLDDARYELYLYLLKENDFEALALESSYRLMYVSVTLSNVKVHIGSIKALPNITNHREHLNLLPILSGYRDKEQTLRIMTDYIELVENYENKLEHNSIADDDFDLVIKFEHIVSMNLFDLEIYEANIDKLIEKQNSGKNTVVNFNFDSKYLETISKEIDLGEF